VDTLFLFLVIFWICHVFHKFLILFKVTSSCGGHNLNDPICVLLHFQLIPHSKHVSSHYLQLIFVQNPVSLLCCFPELRKGLWIECSQRSWTRTAWPFDHCIPLRFDNLTMKHSEQEASSDSVLGLLCCVPIQPINKCGWPPNLPAERKIRLNLGITVFTIERLNALVRTWQFALHSSPAPQKVGWRLVSVYLRCPLYSHKFVVWPIVEMHVSWRDTARRDFWHLQIL